MGLKQSGEKRLPYRDHMIDASIIKTVCTICLEQPAGDVLGANPATGLVAGPFDIVKSPDITLTLTQRQNELDDMIAYHRRIPWPTMGCARCHNHKPIPFSSRILCRRSDFAGVQHGDRPLKTTPPGTKESAKNLEVRTLASRLEQTLEGTCRTKATGSKATQKPVTSTYNEEEWPPTHSNCFEVHHSPAVPQSRASMNGRSLM